MTDEEKKIAVKKCREVDEVEYRREKKREKGSMTDGRQAKGYVGTMIISERRTLC